MFRNSFQLFKNHDTLTLGAALSYYTVFSLAPMMIIVISVVGSILGPEAVLGEIQGQVQSFMGKQSAVQLQSMIKAAYKPGTNGIATIIAVVLLLIGATSVFEQMRTSLNTIWDVKPQAKQPILQFFVNRLFSFAMIGCLGFLLLVSFVIHSGLSAFTNYLNNYLPEISLFIFKLIESVISYFITAVLLAMVYKFMSDAKLKWNSVWLGALFTSFLFSIGKYLIGLYISTSNIGDTYGAAGSVVVVLAWVFYSSQIVFFGAEFTRALAIERGVPLDPKAIKPNVQVGIVNKTVIEKKE